MIPMLLLTTLPVLLITRQATVTMRNSVEREMIGANESRMLWADQYLSELIQQIDMLFYTLQINERLMEGLEEIESPDPEVQFRAAEYIRETLTRSFYANSHKVDELTLYFHAGRRAVSVSYTSSGLTRYQDIREGPWRRMLEGPVNLYFKEENETVSAYHSINRFRDRELLGGFSVKINKKVWQEVGTILGSHGEGSVYIFNDEGEMLSGSTPDADYRGLPALAESTDPEQRGLRFIRDGENWIFTKPIAGGQLSLVKIIPLEVLDRSAARVIGAGIIVGFLFILLTVPLSVLLAFRISRPIIDLAETMQKNDLSSFHLHPVRGRDEIGLLEEGYNSLMKRLRELVEEEYQRELELRDARILALQSQINPHFLHNTLQLMGGMALSRKAPEIYEVTRVIGELLRYSLSSESDLVTLREELKHTNNYLFIQQLRFEDRCTVKMTVDESVLDCPLPRFTLQPLVENSFDHGLQNRQGPWELEIRVKRLGKNVGLLVYDNGSGIPRERIGKIRRDLAEPFSLGRKKSGPDEPVEKRGIGLANVNARIRLVFGPDYGLRLFSRPEEGTLAVVMMPLADKKGIDHV